MKHFLVSAIFFFAVQSAFSQGGFVPGPPAPPTYLRDLFTTRFEPKTYAGITGTPFLDEKWMLAKLTISKYKIVDSILVKLNVYERRLHFKDDRGEELQAAIAFEEILIIDKGSKWYNAVFLPGIGKDHDSYFQVITGGNKAKLVKKLTVNKWESKAVGTEIQKRFELEEKLFLFANGELYKANKNCSAMSALWDDKKIQQYISDNNLKCNKEEDLQKLVGYLNSL